MDFSKKVVFDQRGRMVDFFFSYRDGKWNILSIEIDINQANWINKEKQDYLENDYYLCKLQCREVLKCFEMILKMIGIRLWKALKIYF